MANRSVYGRICRSTAFITATAVNLLLLSVVAGFPEEGNAAVATGNGGTRAAVGGHGGNGDGDLESAWNDVDEGRFDICARNPESAAVCSACPGLVPNSGVTAWHCCVDPAVHEACSGAAAVISRALIEDAETGVNLDKRAKYFLGKRAKYFLGKRAYGARRTGAGMYHGGAFRAAARQQIMADGLETAEKRAKYFLGK